MGRKRRSALEVELDALNLFDALVSAMEGEGIATATTIVLGGAMQVTVVLGTGSPGDPDSPAAMLLRAAGLLHQALTEAHHGEQTEG